MQRGRTMKGGDGGGDWMLKTVGDGGAQYDNVFKSSPSDVSNSNNEIKPLSMSGGKRGRTVKRGRSASRGRSAARGRSASRGRSAARGRSASRGRSKSGGLLGFGPIVSQALVPFTLFGAQKWLR